MVSKCPGMRDEVSRWLLLTPRDQLLIIHFFAITASQSGGGAGGPKVQCEHAAPLRGAQLQAVHILRPLRVPTLWADKAGPAVRDLRHERAQALPKERGQHLWHQH